MAARAKARKRALDILYASEMRNRDTEEALGELSDAGPVNEYTLRLVRGVTENQVRIDEVIGGYAKGWSLGRMPALDRNVLRMATFEILYVDEVPYAVAVSEAMHLVRNLSTDESPGFVNGVLGNIVRDRDALVR